MDIAILAVGLLTVFAPNVEWTPAEPAARSDLCSVLFDIGDGDVWPVTVSGVYVRSFETSTLYAIGCDRDVQPATWVELPSGVAGREALDKALGRDRVARVVLEGKLYGPRVVERDPRWTNHEAELVFVTNRRYGHRGTFRTELVVTRVLDAEPFDEPFERPPDWKPQSGGVVAAMAVPQYPSRARSAGITGEVVVRIKVENGTLFSAETESTSPTLARAAEENVRSWRFGDDVSDQLTVTFVFELSDDEHAVDRVSLELPNKVIVTAPRDRW